MLSLSTVLAVFVTAVVSLPSDLIQSNHKRGVAAASLSPRSSTITARALPHTPQLKYQVVGIVGAYVFWLVVTVVFLVTVGRRLRKRSQRSDPTSNMTMMKTFQAPEQVRTVPVKIGGPSVKSPTSMKSPSKFSFKSWGKKGHKASDSTYSTTTVNSLLSVEQQRAKDMDDLSRLYAAAIAQDEERSQGHPSAAQSPTSPVTASPLSPGYPPEFAHLHNVNAAAQTAQSPVLDQRLHHPMAPTPTTDSFPQEHPSHYDPSIPSRANSRTNKTTPLSFISDVSSRAGSFMSTKSRPSRINIRGLEISQPLGSADPRDAQHFEETVPLSPRVYTPGPPPPTPGNKKQTHVAITPIHEDEVSDEPYPQYDQRFQQQFHQQVPHYQTSPPSQQQPQLAQSLREKRIPPSLALQSSKMSGAQPTTSTKPLPFRDMYANHSLRSAPPTKTTFLDRPTEISAGPRTGIPVPYSPYMPNTPMTPITPRRLMNKQELKARRKEEKLKVLNEDDLVQGDNDMWGN